MFPSWVKRLEVFKFGLYVFAPIGVLYYVNSPEYQEKHIKPYTLFPSAGRTLKDADFPITKQEEQEWLERMERTAPIRRRAKQILQEQRQQTLSDDSIPAAATTTNNIDDNNSNGKNRESSEANST